MISPSIKHSIVTSAYYDVQIRDSTHYDPLGKGNSRSILKLVLGQRKKAEARLVRQNYATVNQIFCTICIISL